MHRGPQACLPACLQVINQAGKQLNQIPPLHPDIPPALGWTQFVFVALAFLVSRREWPVATFSSSPSAVPALIVLCGPWHTQEWVGTAV